MNLPTFTIYCPMNYSWSNPISNLGVHDVLDFFEEKVKLSGVKNKTYRIVDEVRGIEYSYVEFVNAFDK